MFNFKPTSRSRHDKLIIEIWKRSNQMIIKQWLWVGAPRLPFDFNHWIQKYLTFVLLSTIFIYCKYDNLQSHAVAQNQLSYPTSVRNRTHSSPSSFNRPEVYQEIFPKGEGGGRKRGRRREGSDMRADTLLMINKCCNIIITLIINGMINTTFASCKFSKQNGNVPSKSTQVKRSEQVPTSFKEIRESKEANITKNYVISSNKKCLQNQQNTFFNALQEQLTQNTIRKNLIKVEKSKKKVNHTHIYKSPSHKFYEITHLPSKDRPFQLSNYKPKLNFVKNEDNLNAFTPSIIKNHSFTREEGKDPICLTAKNNHTENSQKGSISISSKASFDDSFHLNGGDISYEQDEKSKRQRLDNVNSSMQICKQAPVCKRVINEFSKCEQQLKTMKKSSHFYCSQIHTENRVLKTESQVSVSSSVSNISGSLNFTEKFKHYKRQHTKSELKSDYSISVSSFQRICEIGSGKYGKVYLAKHIQTGFVCAIKSVPKRIIKEENLEVAFIREVKIQMFLSHPNIVKLYGVFHDLDNIHLVMEYCSGSHLFKMIRQRKQFDEDQIISVLSNIFEAVSYIHCHGVIHRDLKPENIVIENGVYKLCDFGWAAYACGDSRTTFCGTPLYVCPEVLKGEEYNSKADIWGLGVITYQLAFGRVPFSIISQNDLMKIIKDPVYFPTWGSTSQKLTPFIKGMLSKNPDHRPTLNEILSCEIFRNYSEKFSGSLKSELKTLL